MQRHRQTIAISSRCAQAFGRTMMSLRRLRNPTNVISVFLLPQEMRTKSDTNSRFPLSILFIFRLAAALPHLPHAAMTSMAWNRCISSYRIIPVSSFVLNFHALTRTKLKFMAEAISPFGGGSVNQPSITKIITGCGPGVSLLQLYYFRTGACAPI